MIQDKARTGNFLTQREILTFIEAELQQTSTYGWTEDFLKR
jgi:hypothetical protein